MWPLANCMRHWWVGARASGPGVAWLLCWLGPQVAAAIDRRPSKACAARAGCAGCSRDDPRFRRAVPAVALLARSLALGALAGARLDLFGGEGALRGALAAVGALPCDGQAVARAESRQVNARDMLEVSSTLGGRAQLKPKIRR